MTSSDASSTSTICSIGSRGSAAEDVLYGERDIYHWSGISRDAFQLALIQEAFTHHYMLCPPFQRYCAGQGVSPASIVRHDDIVKIPLIPSSVFKSLDVRSIPEEEITKSCSSSGTRGRISRVPRDTTTLERFVGAVRVSAEQMLDLHADAEVFNLGPDADEAGDIWFPYVMSLLGLLRPSTNYVVDSTFYPLAVVQDLLTLPPTTQPILVGPPSLFLYLLRCVEAERLTVNLDVAHGFVVTAGGWKGLDEEIDRETFIRHCASTLGVRPENVRDVYNMVELNTVIFECEAGAKHAPPWLCINALNPHTLKPQPSGEVGLLAFYDPLSTSYPGFILSDDFGSISSAPCTCGRTGPTMFFHRRVALVEARGCALAMGQRTRVNTTVRIATGQLGRATG